MDLTISYGLYIASFVGAVALFMAMPRPYHRPVRWIGGLLGAATLGGMWLFLAGHLPEQGYDVWPMVYYYVFSGIAIGAAVRVITHQKPVFSALYFVLVVLASAGLLLVLQAEFMAFAMVIIYAGAILVTYVFVIMLAAQAGDPQIEEDEPEYDRVAREPAAAVTAGFLIMAMLLSLAFQHRTANPAAKALPDEVVIKETLPNRAVNASVDALGEERLAKLPEVQKEKTTLHNVERVGLELFRAYPLGLELAGVILLVSLVGAVVIARQKVTVDEDAQPALDK